MKIEIGTNEAGQRLDKFLRKYLKDVPLSAIFKALRKGDIRVNGKKQKRKVFSFRRRCYRDKISSKCSN